MTGPDSSPTVGGRFNRGSGDGTFWPRRCSDRAHDFGDASRGERMTHVHSDQHSYHLPCHHPGSLSDQHAADRRPRETDRARHRHHHRRPLTAEISRRILSARETRHTAMTRTNVLYLLVGVLAVTAAVLGYQVYQDHREPKGLQINIGPGGLAVEKK